MTENGSAAPGRRPPVDKDLDFANYFCTYGYLYHQKEMLSDRVRMEAYYNSVFRNLRHFRGKVVLDVGTGSGILAIWAAKAGARTVYAVEATTMAGHATTLAKSNGVGDVVHVIQGSIEDIKLPEKVDIIISEWMGYFLVRESMFDSVIIARDRWLKPDGIMYPSHARMWLAPIRTGLGEHKVQEFHNSMRHWKGFVDDTLKHFQVDMAALSNDYRDEQQKYFLQTSVWDSLYPTQVVGQPALVAELDCKTATLEQTENLKADFRMPLIDSCPSVTGFAGWFDVQFLGNKENPADFPVELTTAPSVEATTHWGQQVFMLQPPLTVKPGDVIGGSLEISRSKHNHRLMDVVITHQLDPSPTVISKFFIE